MTRIRCWFILTFVLPVKGYLLLRAIRAGKAPRGRTQP